MTTAAVAALAVRFRDQADYCQRAGSPLNAAILTGAAADLETGGPTATLLTPLADSPPGSVPSLRLAAALHRLVLERRAPTLAVHYPSVGGALGDVWPVARDVIADQLDALHELVRRPVQTNEVGRSSVLLGGLLLLAADPGLPVRLLELGASAGLNLVPDRYAHEVRDDVVLGDPSSPVRLREPWHGPFPPYDTTLEIVERVGCDPAPLDPADADDRLTLTSCVWADQLERYERLRAALHVASAAPVQVERLSASSFLERELADPRPGVTTVVWHSVVRQYMSRNEKDRLDALLVEAGSRATPAAPLAHLAMEPERIGGRSVRFGVSLTTWPGGRTRVLAHCEGHGPPVCWTGT